jgi:membrane-associated phospholipid phosphatase
MAVFALAAVAFSAYALRVNRITVPLLDLAPKVALLAALLAGAAFYRWRGEEKALNLIMTTFWAVLLGFLYVFPMYSAARQPAGWSDAALARVDAALGVEVPDVLRVVGQYPAVDRLMRIAYDTLLLLMSLAVMVPPLCGDMRKSKEYVLGGFFAAAISVPVFAHCPALGPWVHYQFPPSPEQERCMKALVALKGDGWFVLHCREAEGLIACPSFHTILAILAALALRSVPYLRWPAAALASLIVVSTVTTGWHYVSDVLAGVLVAAASVAAARAYLALERKRWPARGLPEKAAAYDLPRIGGARRRTRNKAREATRESVAPASAPPMSPTLAG